MQLKNNPLTKQQILEKVSEGFVYMITNPENKIYIGSSTNIKKRRYSYSILNCKTQTKLYNSLKKYGWNNHIFEIVWTGLVDEMLKYETLIGWGFNVLERGIGLNLSLPKLGDKYKCISEETGQKISESNLGKKHTREFKIKIGNLHRGKIITEETKRKMSLRKLGKNSKKVYQYDLKGNFIKEWDSFSKASKELEIYSSNISMCCSGKYKQAGGYKWSYDFKKCA